MKLTQEQKQLLLANGYLPEDLPQIQRAVSKTIYTCDDRKVTAAQALEILGEREFLSGLSRSAFHFSAVREGKDGETVYFDSHKLFE